MPRPFGLFVAGDSKFDEWELLESKLDNLTRGLKDFILLLGGETSTDVLLRRWAFLNREFLAEEQGNEFGPGWSSKWREGSRPHYREMLQRANAVLLFHNGKEQSTLEVLQRAENQGLQIRIVKFKERRNGPQEADGKGNTSG